MLTSVTEEINGSLAGEGVSDSFTSVQSDGKSLIVVVTMLTRPGAAQSQENKKSAMQKFSINGEIAVWDLLDNKMYVFNCFIS